VTPAAAAGSEADEEKWTGRRNVMLDVTAVAIL